MLKHSNFEMYIVTNSYIYLTLQITHNFAFSNKKVNTKTCLPLAISVEEDIICTYYLSKVTFTFEKTQNFQILSGLPRLHQPILCYNCSWTNSSFWMYVRPFFGQQIRKQRPPFVFFGTLFFEHVILGHCQTHGMGVDLSGNTFGIYLFFYDRAKSGPMGASWRTSYRYVKSLQCYQLLKIKWPKITYCPYCREICKVTKFQNFHSDFM